MERSCYPCRICQPGSPCAQMQRWLAEEAEEFSKADGLDALRERNRRHLRRPSFAPSQPGWVGDHWGQVEVDPAKDREQR